MVTHVKSLFHADSEFRPYLKLNRQRFVRVRNMPLISFHLRSSIVSHDAFQGNEIPYCAQCQQRAQQHETSQTTAPSEPVACPLINVVISPDTTVETTENQYSYSFLTPGTPKPVGTRLKNSTLDVLAVDFGRPPSIYSTGSEVNYELENDVFLKPGNVPNGDVSNGLRPIPG